MSKWFGESLFIILLLSGSISVLTSQFVKAESTSVVETALFPVDHYDVLPMSFNFSTIRIDIGTNVRIVFNASRYILFYCQDSFEFNMSNSTHWTNNTSEWSNETSLLDINYTIPFTDRWFFTFVDNDTGAPVDIYSIAVYRVDTYEIRVESDSQSYNMGAEALFTVTVTNNTDPIVGMNVSLQVFGPDGDVISNQSSLTDDYGNVFAVPLPSEQGIFSCVAKTTIAGSNPIEDSETFAVVSNPYLPSTFDNYDHLWHTSNFTIMLSAFDGNSSVAETYYRINYGPIQNVSANGQPQITMESANNTLEYWSTDQVDKEEVPHKWLTGIELDKTPPTGSILIDANRTYVNSQSIVLALSANDAISGVTKMRFSNDNSTWSDWQAYNSSTNWTILAGEGLKTAYVQYLDNAGLVSGTYSVNVTLDTTDPMIENVSRVPERTVQPLQTVTIFANVTDSGSGVGNVTLSYSTGSITAWLDSQMSLNTTTGLYECSIEGQQANVQVKYMVIAYDNAGNEKIENQQGQYYVYTVVPEQLSLGLSLLLVLSTLSMVVFRKKVCHNKKSVN